MIYVCLFTSFAALSAGNLVAEADDWSTIAKHDTGVLAERWLVETSPGGIGRLETDGKSYRMETDELSGMVLITGSVRGESGRDLQITAIIQQTDNSIDVRIEDLNAENSIRYQREGACKKRDRRPKTL